MGSTRLPGKVLEKLDDRTVLEHVVARARRIAGADVVCIATTALPEDDRVAEAAAAAGAAVFRGDPQDVLARYLGAADMLVAGIVMRVTSDCPLIDPEVCDGVLALRAKEHADYAANNLERSWPHGLDCEAFTREALAQAAERATEPYDREHVTPWLRREPTLRRAHLPGPGQPAVGHRWTLDYPEDLAFLRALFAALPTAASDGWQAIDAFLAARPDIVAINSERATGH